MPLPSTNDGLPIGDETPGHGERHESLEQLRSRLSAWGQEHLLRHYEALTAGQQQALAAQLSQLDLPALHSLYEHAGLSASSAGGAAGKAEPIEPIPSVSWTELSAAERQACTQLGWEALQAGEVGVLIVAGGQGSRLGHPGPKGTFSLPLPSGRSLFQLHTERLLRLSRLAGRSIPLYIMTSPGNHAETERFFADHQYFGFPREDICFFVQGVLPAMDFNGRILLAEPDKVALAPSGSGEAFAALHQSGALADLQRRGVRWLYYANVDNALLSIADPRFVGAAAFHGLPIATKAALKSHPGEKVGMLCLRGGRPAVLEYSEAPEELTHARDEQGRLLYGLGNLSIHLFRTDFIAAQVLAPLPYHAARKAVEFTGEDGRTVRPQEPNAYKFERFIFDYFPLTPRMTVLTMPREEEFAPVKNPSGDDSPESACRLLLDQHRRWLLAAGVHPSRLAGRDIELSPLDSYGGEGLDSHMLQQLGL